MSKVFKGVTKVFNKVAKAVKKVLPAVLAVGAVVFTAGAALGAMPTWGAAISSLTAKMGATGVLSNVLTGALTQAGYGAAIGVATSALTGGSVTKGMQMGALGGAVTGGVMGGLGMNTDPLSGLNEAPAGEAATNVGPLETPTADNIGTGAMVSSQPGGAAGVQVGPLGSAPPAPPHGGYSPSASGGLLKWMERNQTLVGNVVSGGAQGLIKGMAAEDSGEAYERAIRSRQDIINQNYSGTGRGLLTDENMAYLQNQPARPTPGQRFDPRTYGGQYVFDSDLGRIVFVPNQQA
ncbi:hypothetical protein [uncultured Ferrovibrio sp.]|uniref:hypothetical protein n=1 Tax=uncultured Ferrovibrio sp. TaxID=1576913 RepID=UPI0026324842|nr:hypothetical protein [uncultured Ferrovibrio sp.]